MINKIPILPLSHSDLHHHSLLFVYVLQKKPSYPTTEIVILSFLNTLYINSLLILREHYYYYYYYWDQWISWIQIQCFVFLNVIFHVLSKPYSTFLIISGQPLAYFHSNKKRNTEKGHLKRKLFTSDKEFF